MAAPSELQNGLCQIRGWGHVVSALAAQLAESPNNDPLGETMLGACNKLRASWYRVQTLREEGGE